ncbi:protein LAZ1 [Citrus sinensis]|uniref:Protein LAZ1 n=1 Tax=Citrus sinensis TaxID=2711 RepID=A0ACB8IBM8_CITSI|nr:protein LAZ1 [Citrus sinensis]
MRIASYHNLVSLFAYATPIWASLIAGVLVVVTLSLSMYLLFDHLSAYKNPEEQKFLIGVILMVPCYAVESLVLTAKYYGIAMSPLLCIALEDILLLAWMIIKSLTALLAVVLEAFNVYCEGEFKWGCGYPYMAVVLNFSQSWALYCLIQFYTVTKDELAHIKPLAKFLTFKSIVFLTWWQAQMAIASIVHLYVFPAKPYEQMGECFSGDISVLGDYSADCPLDPDEIRDSERPTKLRLPQPDVDIKSGMTIRESVRDVFVGGSGYIVNDVKFTVNQAVEPVEKGITKFNEKIHKISQNIKRHDKDRRKTKDDSCIASSHTRRVIRGIDDPLLNGSISDSAPTRKKHRRKSGYTSGESGGESSSDQNYGGYEIRGRRWVTKD